MFAQAAETTALASVTEETRILAHTLGIEGDGYAFQLQQANERRMKLKDVLSDSNFISKLQDVCVLLRVSDLPVQIGYDKINVRQDLGRLENVKSVASRIQSFSGEEKFQFGQLIRPIVSRMKESGAYFPIKLGDAWLDVTGQISDEFNSKRFDKQYGNVMTAVAEE